MAGAPKVGRSRAISDRRWRGWNDSPWIRFNRFGAGEVAGTPLLLAWLALSRTLPAFVFELALVCLTQRSIDCSLTQLELARQGRPYKLAER
jgi:hypothetical protein